ncbi:MAG: NAD-dependent epimerase/dehydratase family protein [Acidobacteria bacterium]|nr:MAG: NAD-dependent epimerase/dehydratase family protein [Acidobacteriota bacterium]
MPGWPARAAARGEVVLVESAWPEITEDAARPWAGRTVVVTGGLGFIGSTLAIALARAGAFPRILDNLDPLYGGNWRNVAPVADRVTVLVADIRDRRALRAALAGADAVFHLAAQTSHIDSMRDPFLDADVNVRGMLLLLEAIRREAPEAVLVNVGTRAQYGAAGNGPIREDTPARPTDVYGASKHCAEQYALVYHRCHGLDVRCVRATNVYGPRHQMKHGRYGILNWFVRLALDGAELPVYGDGSQRRDYLYVDDLVDALLRVAGGPAGELAGRVFNAGTGSGTAFAEMARQVVAACGSGRLRHVPWPEERRRIETGDAVLDATRLRDATGWNPRIALAEGIERTVRFYRRERKHYWPPAA